MRISIIETGAAPGNLTIEHGDYACMIATLLGPRKPLQPLARRRERTPRSSRFVCSYVVTGSAAGINDGLVWVEELVRLLINARGRTALIGICFGYQLIATTFGGRVGKAGAGWGLGSTSTMCRRRPRAESLAAGSPRSPRIRIRW